MTDRFDIIALDSAAPVACGVGDMVYVTNGAEGLAISTDSEPRTEGRRTTLLHWITTQPEALAYVESDGAWLLCEARRAD